MKLHVHTLTLLFLAAGCDATERLEPPRMIPIRGEVSMAHLSPDEQEREARKLTPCSPPAADPGWPMREDRKQRMQMRMPERYRMTEDDVDDNDGVAWMSPDTSVAVLQFNGGTGGGQTVIGTDEPVKMLDESLCSMPFGGRVAEVLRLSAIGLKNDTTYWAVVSADIRSDFGLAAYIIARSNAARDELLSSLASLQLTK